MNRKLLFLAALGAMLLTLFHWVTGYIIEFPQGQLNNMWGLFANFLVSLLLGYYLVNTDSSLLRKSIYVFLIYFIIGHFNLLIEAYIFNITDRVESTNEIIRGLLLALFYCPSYVLLFHLYARPEASEKLNYKPRTFLGWTWRILLGDFLYLFLYIGAGLILAMTRPEIIDFYEGKIPPFDIMIKTQIFLRGFLFMAVALIILGSMNGTLMKRAIYIGLVFSILGAIAPLIPANDLMPGYVRMGHGVEVSLSNFVFGFLLGFLLGPERNNISPENIPKVH